jgi:hypothetical protein
MLKLFSAWREFTACCSFWRTDYATREGGSEWEPIKILLEGDWNSSKMNPLGRTPKITHSTLLPSVCQNHIATGVLLVLGTNSNSNLNTHAPTTAETTRKPAVQRGAVRPGMGGG